MSIRNSAEIGINLTKIAQTLCANQRLLRLLKYTDNNPFLTTQEDAQKGHDNLSASQLLHKNIKIVPLVKEADMDTESVIVICVNNGTVQDNNEFKSVQFDILVYTPLSEWILNDINLRPFLIISEIEKSLKNKKIESLGTIDYEGFEVELITDLIGCYRMRFNIDVFN